MDSSDKDASLSGPGTEEAAEPATISRAVRWQPSDLERIERAAQTLGERERLNLTAADIIRRGTMKEVDEIERAA